MFLQTIGIIGNATSGCGIKDSITSFSRFHKNGSEVDIERQPLYSTTEYSSNLNKENTPAAFQLLKDILSQYVMESEEEEQLKPQQQHFNAEYRPCVDENQMRNKSALELLIAQTEDDGTHEKGGKSILARLRRNAVENRVTVQQQLHLLHKQERASNKTKKKEQSFNSTRKLKSLNIPCGTQPLKQIVVAGPKLIACNDTSLFIVDVESSRVEQEMPPLSQLLQQYVRQYHSKKSQDEEKEEQIPSEQDEAQDSKLMILNDDNNNNNGKRVKGESKSPLSLSIQDSEGTSPPNDVDRLLADLFHEECSTTRQLVVTAPAHTTSTRLAAFAIGSNSNNNTTDIDSYENMLGQQRVMQQEFLRSQKLLLQNIKREWNEFHFKRMQLD